MSLYGYVSGVEGYMFYVSQGEGKKLELEGVCLSEIESDQLTWKFIETVNDKYNGTYYVVWNAFTGGSKNIIGVYINAKGQEFQVELKCIYSEIFREE